MLKLLPARLPYQLLLVFLFALFARVLAELVLGSAIPAWTSGSSISFRIGLAESLLRGAGFSLNGVPSLYQTPGYPFFLAVVFFLFGQHWWPLVIAQALLDSLSSVGIALLGRRFTPNGWIAGLLYGAYPYAILQTRSVIDTTLFISLFIWSIVLYVQFCSTLRWRHLVAGSILLGLGALVRPSILPVALGLAAWLAFSGQGVSRALTCLIVAGAIAVAAPLAWTVRNYQLVGQFPVFTVGGAHAVWYGHNRHILKIYQTGDSPDEVGRNARYPMQPNIQVGDFFSASPKDRLELAKICAREASAWRSTHLSEVGRYTLLKLKTIFSWEYVPRSISAPFHEARVWLYRLTNGPILLFGWLGLGLLAWRRDRLAPFFLAVAIGFVILHAATLVVSRHKLPLDALLISFVPYSIGQVRLLLKSRLGLLQSQNT